MSGWSDDTWEVVEPDSDPEPNMDGLGPVAKTVWWASLLFGTASCIVAMACVAWVVVLIVVLLFTHY